MRMIVIQIHLISAEDRSLLWHLQHYGAAKDEIERGDYSCRSWRSSALCHFRGGPWRRCRCEQAGLLDNDGSRVWFLKAMVVEALNGVISSAVAGKRDAWGRFICICGGKIVDRSGKGDCGSIKVEKMRRRGDSVSIKVEKMRRHQRSN